MTRDLADSISRIGGIEMSAKHVLALSAALGVLGFSAHAAPLDYIVMINGNCTRMVFAGHDGSSTCVPKIINDVHKDGRVGFTFVVGDTAVITFSGMGQRQVKQSANVVSQPLDAVIVTMTGAGTTPSAFKTDGVCTYSNPYAGPAEVTCSARTSNGLFEAKFLSDGQAPSLQRF